MSANIATNCDGLRSVIYKPLQGAQGIRLLRVKASSIAGDGKSSDSQSEHSSQEEYELVHVSLDIWPIPYEAVSYAWGDTTQDHSLGLKGHQVLPITKTLATALPRLIKMCSTGYLWIDQICIDQSNNQERSQQVSMMGKIFSDATEVLIWTGEELNGLREMQTQLIRCLDFEEIHTEALIQLHCRPWFSRGWTIQEAALAKRAIVIAGSWFSLLENIERAWYKSGKMFYGDAIGRCRVGKAAFENIMALRRGGSVLLMDSGFDGLLNNLADSQMSDARDHVYAFLGLKNDPRVTIKPDYNASVSEVFTDATRAMIEGTGTLDCFRFLPRPEKFGRLILPSWVPDWSTRYRATRIQQDPLTIAYTGGNPSFIAAKGFSHKSRTSPPRASILHVSGRIIDAIQVKLPNIYAQVYEALFEEERFSETACPLFFSLTDEQVKAIDERALTDPMRNLRERLISVLLAGYLDAEQVLARYDRRDDSAPALDGSLDLHLRRMCDFQLCITQSKRLALIPPITCEEGDKLAIIHGLNAPVLLKSIGDGTYSFGGQCYLENAMFGEAVTWEEEDRCSTVGIVKKHTSVLIQCSFHRQNRRCMDANVVEEGNIDVRVGGEKVSMVSRSPTVP